MWWRQRLASTLSSASTSAGGGGGSSSARSKLFYFAATGTAMSALVGGYYAYNNFYADSDRKHRFSHSAMMGALGQKPIYADPLMAHDTPIGERPHAFWTPPSREQMLNRLKGKKSTPPSPPAAAAATTTSNEEDKGEGVKEEDDDEGFDLLIIGAGATGAGCALDAASRGLKVALVERDDFASGTSSKSTKLIHGGVRYLQKAIMGLDYDQYKMVCEALHERKTFLHIAPYLSNELPILLPVYKWWQLPYFWFGCKMYDMLAGSERITPSYMLGRKRTLESFPMLKSENLVGAVVYYDGQHNDSRMNVTLAVTAAAHGAVVANHTEVLSLIKEMNPESGQDVVKGAVVRDNETGETWEVKAKGVINATGPFSDAILKMDTPKMQDIVAPSAGVHLVLPSYFSPKNMGMLDPATSDGRVVFFLPWEGGVVAGTTDTLCDVTPNPIPSEKEIEWILNEIRRFLSPDVKVRRGDVLAAWSGIRPLVRDPKAKNTKDLVRNHMIHISESKLITIAGGKWTTYREMAKETIDEAIKTFVLSPVYGCRTESTRLIGSHTWSETMFIKLAQNFGLDADVAKALSHNYGDRAWAVCAMAERTGRHFPVFGTRLHPSYPFIESEVKYAVECEYARTVVDVIARRMRLAFLDAHAAFEVVPKVIELMANELKWSPERQQKEYTDTLAYLQTMGLPKTIVDQSSSTPLETSITKEGYVHVTTTSSLPFLDMNSYYHRGQFSADEIGAFRAAFADYDDKGDGYIKVKHVEPVLKALNLPFAKDDLSKLLNKAQIDPTSDDKPVEFEQVLIILSDIKEKYIQEQARSMASEKKVLNRIPTSRSGGSV
ncbi:mitochondrial glycerol-3-phosphate dehydrogenase [Mycoemilia scoparia]|uniref:glycerol-3-phosphate dehydrogenase n=1 Tax=Mycoemilia scoparia TaxID=417184 RepID=A0A9W8A2C0_9FUNG|nr:mitochondrial glycerol-3-phosphate dehydrogenase [Mycoemilia scoparia]